MARSQKDLGRPEFGSHNWRWSHRLADAARLALAAGISTVQLDRLQPPGRSAAGETRKYIARGLVRARPGSRLNPRRRTDLKLPFA
jgi:hypothetical protein